MGREAASSPPNASANCLAISMFFCSLIPRPTATMISAWVRSTACLASLKTSCGLLRTTPSAIFTFTVSTGAALAPLRLYLRGRLRSGKLRTMERGGKADVSRQFALEHLACEQELVGFLLEANQSLITVRPMAVASLGMKSRTW